MLGAYVGIVGTCRWGGGGYIDQRGIEVTVLFISQWLLIPLASVSLFHFHFENQSIQERLFEAMTDF